MLHKIVSVEEISYTYVYLQIEYRFSRSIVNITYYSVVNET